MRQRIIHTLFNCASVNRPLLSLFMGVLLAVLSPWTALAKTPDGKFTIIIDAGHGGKDIGATDNGVMEKNINLKVAKELESLIKKNMKNARVVMTRDADYYLTLQQRADIANKEQGDIFISIHTNSVDKKNKNRASIAGSSVYTLGLHKDDDNLKVAMRENSVIELENDFEQKYSGFDPERDESYIIFEMAQKKNLSQSIRLAEDIEKELVASGRKDRGVHQAGFWVLWATSMPAVLVELDFICNPTSAAYISSDKGAKEMAQSIFNAVEKYEEVNALLMASNRTNSNLTKGSTRAKKNKTETSKPASAKTSDEKNDEIAVANNKKTTDNKKAAENKKTADNKKVAESKKTAENKKVAATAAPKNEKIADDEQVAVANVRKKGQSPKLQKQNGPVEESFFDETDEVQVTEVAAQSPPAKTKSNVGTDITTSPRRVASTGRHRRSKASKSLSLNNNYEFAALTPSLKKNPGVAESIDQIVTSNTSKDKKSKKEEAKARKAAKAAEKKAKKASHNAKVNKLVTVYRIQILASEDLLNQGNSKFCGLTPVTTYKENNIYKYYYGESTDKKEAEEILAAVRKKIPNAFIVPGKKSVQPK